MDITNHNNRLASAEHITEAMRKYVILCIDWVNALFYLAHINSVADKVNI